MKDKQSAFNVCKAILCTSYSSSCEDNFTWELSPHTLPHAVVELTLYQQENESCILISSPRHHFRWPMGNNPCNTGFKHDAESAAVLHKYKHVAGNPLKLNTPVLTYLNEVDKHTANYAYSGFGEESAATFPTTKTWFALQIKALSGSTSCTGSNSYSFFFFLICQVERQNGCLRSPSLL